MAKDHGLIGCGQSFGDFLPGHGEAEPIESAGEQTDRVRALKASGRSWRRSLCIRPYGHAGDHRGPLVNFGFPEDLKKLRAPAPGPEATG